ncbi:MAG: molybdopterin molybdotransferase MoeA [Maricaulis sp.]|nr:molybdopterin molybdotransferase MoeA [Maricaulis sp.]
MPAVDAALDAMLAALSPLVPVERPLADCGGAFLAKPLVAQWTQPPFAASAMDGYAVRSADLAAGPEALRLVGEAAAGHAFSRQVGPGEAVRISTGAPVPDGADQVVMQEKASRSGDAVRLADTSRPMANIRPAGTDFSRGDRLLEAGRRLSPDAVALAAAARVATLHIHPRPRVAILATGDELVEPGEPAAGPSQIVNSVAPGLVELVRIWGGEPVYLGIARDRPEAVRDALYHGRDGDLTVTVGGASVGGHDHLRAVFQADGGRFAFERIAARPGKPTWFGIVEGHPVLGLPGNPVSALVMARLFLRPALARLGGGAAVAVFAQAPLAVALEANDWRETYLRATRDDAGHVAPLPNQDSSALSALVQADCLIRRPAGAQAMAVGERVEILSLSDRA